MTVICPKCDCNEIETTTIGIVGKSVKHSSWEDKINTGTCTNCNFKDLVSNFKHLLYIPFNINSWNDFQIESNHHLPTKIDFSKEKSCGYLLVYEDLESLKKDYPESGYQTVMVGNKPTL